MVRPKKEPSRRHSEEIRFRARPEDAAVIRRAAKHAADRRGTGTLSDWLRATLLKAARKELDRPGR